MLVAPTLRIRAARSDTPVGPVPTPAPTAPSPGLAVPAAYADAITGAAHVGRLAATDFVASHPRDDAWLFRSYIVKAGGYAPGAAIEGQELASLHELQAARTPKGSAEMIRLDRDGGEEQWNALLDSSSLDTARKAQVREQMATALVFANDVAQTVKGASMRSRPFVVDPTITPLGRVPGNNPSYPSGHATAAFATAEVLAAALPERRADIEALATKIAFSRLYGGMHFPSDVTAGARIGAMVGAFLVTHDS